MKRYEKTFLVVRACVLCDLILMLGLSGTLISDAFIEPWLSIWAFVYLIYMLITSLWLRSVAVFILCDCVLLVFAIYLYRILIRF
jgi:hypothetical protein